jgi:hypothetical protein
LGVYYLRILLEILLKGVGMASSSALDQEVGGVVATLSDGTEYRQVLLNPTEGETHVTPDGRKWIAVHEEVVDGKVITSPLTIHWRGVGATNSDVGSVFVRGLQQIVQQSQEFNSSLDAAVAKINEQSLAGLGQPTVTLNLQTDQKTSDGRPALRVTCPTPTEISTQVPDSVRAHTVEFYLTRPRANGIAETRPLGTSKYSDGDGRRRVTFTTQRFARVPNDALVVHAEVLNESGRLLAIFGGVVIA